VLALLAALALAPPAEPPTFSDRPDVTNGTLTVPTGAWQLETGVDAELAQRTDASPLAIESTLRIGIHQRAELRLLEGDLHEWITAAADEDGSFVSGTTARAAARAIDDVPLLEFSAKVRLTEENIRRYIPSLGLQPIIAFRPPGRAYRGLPVVALVFIVSQPFGRITMLDMNASVRVDGNVSVERMVSGYVSGSLGVQVHPRVLLYAELLGVVAVSRAEVLIVDGGALFTVHPRLIFDVSARVSPIGEYQSAGVSVGLTAMIANGKRVRAWQAARQHR
jgi:hypothetical protein